MKIVYLLSAVAALISLSVYVIHLQYVPLSKGEIYLKRANGTATLLREAPHGIHHIHADSLEMAFYTQGFATA